MGFVDRLHYKHITYNQYNWGCLVSLEYAMAIDIVQRNLFTPIMTLVLIDNF